MSATPTVLIIIGITGDLAKRKLLPAIGLIKPPLCSFLLQIYTL